MTGTIRRSSIAAASALLLTILPFASERTSAQQFGPCSPAAPNTGCPDGGGITCLTGPQAGWRYGTCGGMPQACQSQNLGCGGWTYIDGNPPVLMNLQPQPNPCDQYFWVCT